MKKKSITPILVLGVGGAAAYYLLFVKPKTQVEAAAAAGIGVGHGLIESTTAAFQQSAEQATASAGTILNAVTQAIGGGTQGAAQSLIDTGQSLAQGVSNVINNPVYQAAENITKTANFLANPLLEYAKQFGYTVGQREIAMFQSNINLETIFAPQRIAVQPAAVQTPITQTTLIPANTPSGYTFNIPPITNQTTPATKNHQSPPTYNILPIKQPTLLQPIQQVVAAPPIQLKAGKVVIGDMFGQKTYTTSDGRTFMSLNIANQEQEIINKRGY